MSLKKIIGTSVLAAGVGGFSYSIERRSHYSKIKEQINRKLQSGGNFSINSSS